MRNSNSKITSRFVMGLGDLITYVNSVRALFEWLITCTSSLSTLITLVCLMGSGSPEIRTGKEQENGKGK